MNAGLSNLAFIKSQLLAAALRASTDYDAQIQALGLGITSQMERYCNRKFMRTVGAVDVFPADRVQFLLTFSPVEIVTGAAVKQDETDGFINQLNNPEPFIRIIDYNNGMVDCGSTDVGKEWQQVQFSYTGGYFWEQQEPTINGVANPAYPTAVPATAFLLPNDLLLAWILQCKYVWQIFDPLNTKIAAGQESGPRAIAQQVMGDLDLLPAVQKMIAQYVRYGLV
ncbi:MAG: hypothetical protein KGJ13_03560 [Patescibacteria group bacterium]|nr:hypothetical protein [Patescibacteria group bacterium]